MKSRILTRDTLLIMIASFFYMASPMLVTPLVTGFTETLGAGGAAMGMIAGLTNLTSMFCRPVVGNLADRISKYRLSTIGGILMLISCLGYVFASNTMIVVAARIINGVGFSCCSVCMSTWMSSLLPRDKIGSGMGLYGTVNALSMAISPVIGVRLMKALGYRYAFGAAAVFCALLLILVPLVHDKGMPTIKKDEGRKLSFAIFDKKVIPIAFMMMLYGIPYFATQSFLVRYCEVRNLSVSFSLFFTIYAGFLLVLRLSLKSLFDRLPFGIFAVTGCCVELLGMVCMTFLYNNWVMIAAAFCMAAGYGLMCSVCQSTALLLAGEGKRGLANSTYYLGLDLGMTLGPIIGGFLYGNVDISMFYPVLYVTMPVCVLIYFFTMRKMK